MVKIVQLPLGAKFRFPDGFGVFEGITFYVSHIPDDKSYVEVETVDSSDFCIEINPDVIVVSCD